MRSSDCAYLVARFERVIELIKDGEHHMAIAKLLADISALRSGYTVVDDDSKELIKKLARRIHNQRTALRQDYMFQDKHREEWAHRLNPHWFRKVLVQGKIIRTLRARLKVTEQQYF